MDKHIAERWVEALRSGKYEQGRAELHPGENSYCCLGVLCDLYRVEQGKGQWDGASGYCEFVIADTEEAGFEVPPDSVLEWAGLNTPEGSVGEQSLAEMNDNGATFTELADIIAKKWEVL